MTGPTEKEDDKKIAPQVDGSEAFRKFIRDELMPQIRERYRTTNETAIVGESLAGLFVVESFLLEADLFDTYIAIDPSLWWKGHKLVNEAGQLLRARPRLKKTLYFASSDEKGIVDDTQRFAEVLGRMLQSACTGITKRCQRKNIQRPIIPQRSGLSVRCSSRRPRRRRRTGSTNLASGD
jgi:predicted alpha/beta superfamily hydrolase